MTDSTTVYVRPIFERKIYLNTMDDVQAVVEVLKKNIDLMVLEPARVGSYD